MADYVLTSGARHPDKTALTVIGTQEAESWSFADLLRAVQGTARGLMQSGLACGDRVLMRLGNTVDFPVCYLGALWAGMVPVPTSAALTLGEVARIIADVDPALVLQAPGVACPAHPRIVPLDGLRHWRSLPSGPPQMGDPNRLGYIVYTSGTSGVPRAVGHAHRAIWARRMMFDGWYGLTPQDRMLHAGAFNWTYTLGTGLMDPWTVGASALIPAAGTAATALPDLAAAHGATLFAAAPGVYRQMLKRDGLWPRHRLRHGLSAGEKLSPRLAQAWQAATGTPIFEAFGMSECSTFISGAPARPVPADVIGRPQPGRRVALLGADGPVPLGTEGTIAVHRSDPGLMLGYIDAPEETKTRMQGDWFLTGDQGTMTEDHQIRYLGRADDMMNAGGFRVSPLEVEAVLATMPGVTAVGVTEVEVKADARVIAAFYTGPAPLDPGALADYVSDKLARYKHPRLYVHLADLPTGANGKIRRSDLRAQFEAPS